MCFITTYDTAFKFDAGVGAFLDSFDDKGYIKTRSRIAFDNIFNFFILLIMIDIVTGILIDTFGYLRDLDNEKLEDKLNVCFICGLEK